MAIPSEKDWLSVLQEGLERYYNANPRLKQVMRAGILEGYTTTRVTKTPDVMTEKDLPALFITPSITETELDPASCFMTQTVTCNIELVTGDLKYNYMMAPFQAAFVAATRVATKYDAVNGPKSLTWRGSKFVTDLALGSFQYGMGLPQVDDNGMKDVGLGFTSLGTLNVYLHLDPSAVEAWSLGQT